MINFILAALMVLGSTPASVAAPMSDCGEPDGTAALLDATQGQIFVIGELHGTEQAPAFTAAVICLALQDGERVAIGLEMASGNQQRIDAFMDSSGDQAAIDALTLGSRFWTRATKDGRDSRALFALIEHLRRVRAAGQPVSVYALDFGAEDMDLYEAYPQHELRDRAMTRRALSLAERYDRVVVLVGNIHARRTVFEFGEIRQETLGSLAGDQAVASIVTVYAPGEAWFCRRHNGQSACGVHPAGRDRYSGAPRVLSYANWHGTEDEPAYDHVVFLGPATSSPPFIAAAD